MPGAELPPIPRRSEFSGVVPADGLEQQWPASLGPWVAALFLWPVVDERSFRLVARRFSDGRGPEWTFLSSLLVHAGLVESAPTPGAYVVRTQWRPALERQLQAFGGEDATRAKLVDAWIAEPDVRLVPEIAQWARRLERWDAMEMIWLVLGERTGDRSTEALEVLRDLPLEARRARPILSWASGAADALLADNPRKEAEAVLQRLLLDSALLHADWSVRGDTDEAVSAGTFRMIGERRLPSTRPAQSLDAAWRTKLDIDAFIDARARAGQGPGRSSQAVFHAFSACLALFRLDLTGAINEARWAGILADWEPVSAIAAGVEALVLSISTDDGPARHSDPGSAADGDLGVRGMRGQGRVFEILADANQALRRLDRDDLDRCLGLVDPEAAALAGVWSMRRTLAAWRTILWDEPDDGVGSLSSELGRLPTIGGEHDEPLGRALLGNARVMRLTKLGAFGAAMQAAEALPDDLRLLPMARIHLWAGQFRQAVRLADAGPYQPGLELAERHCLTLVGAAASLLEGAGDESARRGAVREVKRLLTIESFLNVALLPKVARDALIELCRPEIDPDDPAFLRLQERLAGLNDAGSGGVGPVRLTEREAILLPLLATDDPVPEIARKLHVSVNTVRKQVVTLREKFSADTRAELVRRARAYGAIR